MRSGEPPLAAGKSVGPTVRMVHLLVDTAVAYMLFVAIVVADYLLSSGVLLTFSMQLSPFLIIVSLLVAYYVLTESLFGRTAGKLITGTRVVAIGGARAPVWRIVLRTLARLIPFDALSFLVPGTRGWHDALSGTEVVRIRGRPGS